MKTQEHTSNSHTQTESIKSRLKSQQLDTHKSSTADSLVNKAKKMTSMQVIIAFLVAGFGNVGAGVILSYVQEWPVFTRVSELFVLVPALLGLKGNLEMTMASRLSTQANLGHMTSMREILLMAKGNLALIQCQATVVSFMAAVFAASESGAFNWDNALVLCASSLLTANIACFVLGTIMVIVIVVSHKVNIDPDNVAAPIAASLGDMTTAALLAVIAQSIYLQSLEDEMPYLSVVIILLFFAMLPIWINVASTNPYTANVITSGWLPIGIAVIISSLGGLILNTAKSSFSRLPVFQPVINGVGGNLVAVQASRLSTSLHKSSKLGELPLNTKLFVGPGEVFFRTSQPSADSNASTARLLLIIALPAHLMYFHVIRMIEGFSAGDTTILFVSIYLTFAMLQIAILLYMAQNLVNILWKLNVDPDNYATPLLTATGDLLGCAFLLFIFLTARKFNDPFTFSEGALDSI